MSETLYASALLEWAARLPTGGLLPDADAAARKRSMVCGSEVAVSIKLAGVQIGAIGLDVEACALGQAAASILYHHAPGASVEELQAAKNALEGMLAGQAYTLPSRFADLSALESVRSYPRRHASTLLAFRAAVEAMETALNDLA